MKRNIIHIDLESRDEYINKYDNSRISIELDNYIIEEALKLDKSKISIMINTNYEINEEEKKELKRMLFKCFRDNVKDLSSKNKNFMSDLFLILIGVSSIIISIMFSYLKVNILSEVFLIFGWVPIWEFFANILFTESSEIVKRKKYKQLLNSTIKFKYFNSY